MELTEDERDYWRNAVEGIHKGKVEAAKIYLREKRNNYSPTNKAIIIQIIAEAVGEPFNDDVRSLIGDLMDTPTRRLQFGTTYYDLVRRHVYMELVDDRDMNKYGNKEHMEQLRHFVYPSILKKLRDWLPAPFLRPGHRTWDYG